MIPTNLGQISTGRAKQTFSVIVETNLGQNSGAKHLLFFVFEMSSAGYGSLENNQKEMFCPTVLL